MSKHLLTLSDEDGDTLRLVEVGGFGEPMLALFVTQEGEESGVNVNREWAKALRDSLNGFLRECDG